jgi:hypothetical protein
MSSSAREQKKLRGLCAIINFPRALHRNDGRAGGDAAANFNKNLLTPWVVDIDELEPGRSHARRRPAYL